MRFKLSYRKQTREVIILAPFREFAIHGVGANSDEDVTPMPLDSASEWITKKFSKHSPKGDELERFFTEMERCMRTGLSEVVALKLVTPMAKSPFFRGVLSGLRFLIERKGMKMGDAMSLFPTAFDPVSIELKRAGEAGGKQTEVYGRMAKRAAAARSLQGKFMMAMVTPGITLFFLTAAVLVMHFQVFPNLEANFKEIRLGSGTLPLPTRIVVGISGFVRSYPLIWALPIGAFTYVFVNRKKIFVSKWFERALVRTPVVGLAYRMIIMARSLSALALLEADGVAMEQCYKLAARVAGHHEYRDYFLAIYTHIARGRKPYSAFLAERYRIGPEGIDLASRMEVAATTGDVAKSLQDAAMIMQEVADVRLEGLPKLIGPVVTVMASVVVGLLVMAVFLPTFSLLIDALRGGIR